MQSSDKYILDEDFFKEQYKEAAADIRVRKNLTVNEGCEGRFENLWNQAFKQIVESGWDVTGRDKKANQYIQGTKAFVTYLANDTKITKLKNYKNSDVIEFERTLIDNNYSVNTIKPYMSGVQAFHGDFLKAGGTKNKIQDASTIHDRCELPKRQNGVLDRAWTDREYEEFLRKAKEDGRNDVYYGFKMGDEFGVRIQSIGRLTLKQVNKALKDGIASIYSTNITINKVGAINLDNAEYVQVGISLEDRYVIIKPVNINDIDFVDKNLLLNLTYGPTYARISNSDLIKMIEQKFELEFNSTPRKFKTKYIEGDNLLLIDLNKEV